MDNMQIDDYDKLKKFNDEHCNHILHYLKNLHDYIEKYGNNILKEYDLTLAQGHVLGFLLENKTHSCTLKELEKSMNVAQSTCAGVVSRLEKKGFLRTYTDKNDKRIKIIELREDAEDLLVIVEKSIFSVETQLLSNLTEIERILFTSLLLKIMDNLE